MMRSYTKCSFPDCLEAGTPLSLTSKTNEQVHIGFFCAGHLALVVMAYLEEAVPNIESTKENFDAK